MDPETYMADRAKNHVRWSDGDRLYERRGDHARPAVDRPRRAVYVAVRLALFTASAAVTGAAAYGLFLLVRALL